ncbi:NAD-dependent epimerase/dehydratase family protein [Histomonas meleagridis]|uniref:NAD-dependent epimerase/dehydratase family protein n=1 Tax=Histomonas meleagridis TaxID=135588 RepID=UPI003559E28C|nr:NAD-dependent epimerase/dehydratase family protein [Histomonas meleagridis]KAH0798424.1 NAD-dependent epimerase/dehydratase family protein [Histomonas meleagridis]
MSSKPKVIILGGTGFVGRHMVRYLIENDLASLIRVCDKNRPEMSWFTEPDFQLFKNPIVEYKMSNLVNEQSVEKAFALDNNQQFDIVINLATTGGYGKDAEFYEQKILRVATVCGAEAKKRNIPKWIEVSTGQVYASSSKPSTETSHLKPWTALAASKLQAEKVLLDMGFPCCIILRPATIYGPGDITGLMPRIVIGAVYKHANKKMKLLWTSSLEVNTVHVVDVCAAIWFLVEHGKPGEIYNIVDKNKTDQGKINELVGKIFGIKTGFVGSVMSNFAKVNFKSIIEQVNDDHMQPWGEITQKNNIDRTPLSPFLDPELLTNSPLSIDGSKLESLGYQIKVPAPTVENLRESIDYWIAQKAFPPL